MNNKTLEGSNLLDPVTYAKAAGTKTEIEGITPLQVAKNLKKYWPR